MAPNVNALTMSPFTRSHRHGPPLLGRVQGKPLFPDVIARMQPSDSLPPSATTPVPLVVAYLDADSCSVPHGPTTRAPAYVPCVGDGSPALRHTGYLRGEVRASQVTRPSSSYVLWSNTPPDTAPSSPTHAGGHCCLRYIPALSASGKIIGFEAAIPRPARLLAYASLHVFPRTAQG